MKRTLYILALILFLVLITLAGKVEFLYYNRDVCFFTIGDVAEVLWQGLPLDLRVIAIMVIPVWVITAFSLYFVRMPLRRIAGPYLFVAVFLSTAITCGGLIMYENWKFLLDASIFSYMSSPGNVSSSVSTGYIVSRLGLSMLAALVLSVVAVVITPSRIVSLKRRSRHIPPRYTLPYMLTGVLLLIMIFGINGRKANEASAFHSDKILLNHAAINPVGHMVHSMLVYAREPHKQFKYMEDDECRKIFAEIFPENTDDVTVRLLKTTRPNVLTIQLESFGAPFIQALGGQKDVAPEISAWMSRGVNFTNAWATSFRTDRGTVSALSGYVAFPTESLMMRDECLTSLPSLARTLKAEGYSTDYLYGGNAQYMNKGKYLRATGFDKVWDINDLNVPDDRRSCWGANDSTALMSLLSLMQETYRKQGSDGHFYWGCQTIDSHEPFRVPYHRLKNKVYNAFAYTDHCVGEFLDSLSHTPLWDNLLVIIFADHGHMYNTTFSNPEFFHMPLLFTGGAVEVSMKTDILISQSDIVGTLLSQMEIAHSKTFPWSRNVFSKNYTYPFVYSNYPSGAMFRDQTGTTIYDLWAGHIIMESPAKSADRRLRNLQTMIQYSYGDDLLK